MKNGRLAYSSGEEGRVTEVYNELVVPIGGECHILLDDGTEVWLNADSKLKYPIAFSGESREVILSGEAYFDVAKNKDCPFIIQSQDYKIRVLGTTFNLNNYEDSEELQLTLCTGKVLMNFGEEQLKLTPASNWYWIKPICIWSVSM